jgi:hypothetical protein
VAHGTMAELGKPLTSSEDPVVTRPIVLQALTELEAVQRLPQYRNDNRRLHNAAIQLQAADAHGRRVPAVAH